VAVAQVIAPLKSSANHAADFSETKLVRKPELPSVPPTICFTLPSCRSMHERNIPQG
jgi:hypothetical protein